ncbi:MAG: hypothetical protein IT251_03510 [Chitinophagaceae bacterium]|nr:hypothetical protein [Chitinophagaceae bacterium]
MKLARLTTNKIKQQIISNDADIQYWEDKLNASTHFTRRNYYRQKLQAAKFINEQAKAELAKRTK